MTGLIRAELRKLGSTRLWLWLLLGALFLAALNIVLTLSFAGDPQSGFPARDDPAIQPLIFNPATGAVVFVVVLAVIGITQENRHRTATPTFLTTPQRGRVLLAKLITYAVAGLLYGVATAALLLIVGVTWLSSVGVSVSLSGTVLDVLVGGTVAVAIYGLIGVGVGALVGNQVAAVVGALIYLFVLEPIVGAIPATGPVYKWLPGGAQGAMTAMFQGPELLDRWAGTLLLIGYGVVSAALAVGLTLRRDIT